jgi:hypothetical protein
MLHLSRSVSIIAVPLTLAAMLGYITPAGAGGCEGMPGCGYRSEHLRDTQNDPRREDQSRRQREPTPTVNPEQPYGRGPANTCWDAGAGGQCR